MNIGPAPEVRKPTVHDAIRQQSRLTEWIRQLEERVIRLEQSPRAIPTPGRHPVVRPEKPRRAGI
jgi:hypothetical protein